MSMAERVRQLRKARRLSQDDLAKQAGINKETINRAELGGNVTIATLFRIAGVFDVTPAELLEGSADLAASARPPDRSSFPEDALNLAEAWLRLSERDRLTVRRLVDYLLATPKDLTPARPLSSEQRESTAP